VSVVNLETPVLTFEQWGVHAHSGTLHTNPAKALVPKGVTTIDVENNQDGSCAGIGYTCDGVNIYFLSDIKNKEFFADCKLVGAGIKYDIQMLRKWGFNVNVEQIYWDIALAEYVRNSTTGVYGLKDLNKQKFGISYPTYQELCGKGKKAVDIGTLSLDVISNYNGMDVLSTHKHYVEQIANMTEEQVRYMTELELPTMRVLTEMMERGVLIDTSYLRSLDKRFGDEIVTVTNRVRGVAGAAFNPNSPKQVKESIVAKTGLRLQTTAAEELGKYEKIPFIADLLRYRTLSKLKGTYTEGLIERSKGEETYRLKARFNQTVTQTGRLSSSEPNLQNIPTRTKEGDEIRGAFIAHGSNELIDSDYSQIEPRLMAHFSGDEKLINIFKNDQDLYDGVALTLGLPLTKENRTLCKTLWLAISYNAGAFKISKKAGMSQGKAQQLIDTLRREFSTLFYWKDKVMQTASVKGHIRTLFGRVIPLDQEWFHLAPNYTIQGSAAEIMKLALIATRHLGPVSTVHDEIIFESTTDQSVAIREIMESVVELKVPLKVDVGVGRTWKEAKGNG
jgi:DNA polymerase-1